MARLSGICRDFPPDWVTWGSWGTWDEAKWSMLKGFGKTDLNHFWLVKAYHFCRDCRMPKKWWTWWDFLKFSHGNPWHVDMSLDCARPTTIPMSKVHKGTPCCSRRDAAIRKNRTFFRLWVLGGLWGRSACVGRAPEWVWSVGTWLQHWPVRVGSCERQWHRLRVASNVFRTPSPQLQSCRPQDCSCRFQWEVYVRPNGQLSTPCNSLLIYFCMRAARTYLQDLLSTCQLFCNSFLNLLHMQQERTCKDWWFYSVATPR